MSLGTHRAALAATAAALTLSACAVGPNYRAPDSPVRESWIAPIDTAEVDTTWWRALGDPLLAQLVSVALVDNKDVAEAGARVREARAARDAVRGRARPQLGLTASVTENRLSSNGQLPVTDIPGFDSEYVLGDVGFDASWEVDLWGSARRKEESASARAQATVEARHGTLLRIVAEVVRSYVDLRAAQAIRVTRLEEVEALEEVARIVERRVIAGASSNFDLVRARAQASAAAAEIPEIEARAAAAAFAIALLTGRPPEALAGQLGVPRSLPAGDPPVSAGLRTDLLRRRPDVRQAERDLAAATSDTAAARAERFPRLTLVGGVGQQAREAGDLLDDDSRRFQFGPILRWPIFSGGRIAAQIRVADARAAAAAIRYERAVLTALSDSETSINRYVASRAARLAWETARSDAASAVRIARQRYLAGEDDLLLLLQAQIALAAAERARINAHAAQLQYLAVLYKALGGGWHGPPPDDAS